MKLREYIVEWRITLDAASAEDAANLARKIQLDPSNTANHFGVWGQDEDDWYEIDADLTPQEVDP